MRAHVPRPAPAHGPSRPIVHITPHGCVYLLELLLGILLELTQTFLPTTPIIGQLLVTVLSALYLFYYDIINNN